MNICSKHKNLDLSLYFKALISETESVPEEAITPEWLREQRTLREPSYETCSINSSSAKLKSYDDSIIAATVSAAGYDL